MRQDQDDVMGKTAPGSRRGRWLIVGVAVAATFATVAILLSMRASPRPQPSADVSDHQSPAIAASIADGRPLGVQHTADSKARRVDPRTVPALPALETPLRQSIEDLRERAAQGDALAACRIAAEYEWCERSRQRQTMSARRLEALRTTPPQAAPDAARASRRLEQATRFAAEAEQAYRLHCEGAPVLGAAERAGYWRQAALQGHLPSMRHYANGNAFRFDDILDALPELTRYRAEAESMALRAANAGDMAMTYALAMGYAAGADGGRRSFLAQAVQPDEARALVLFRRLSEAPGFAGIPPRHPVRRAVGANLPGLSTIVDSAAQAQAARAMGDYRPVPGASPIGTMPRAFENGGLGDAERQACDRRDFLPSAG